MLVRRTISIFALMLFAVTTVNVVIAYLLNSDTIKITKEITIDIQNNKKVDTLVYNINDNITIKDLYKRIKRHDMLNQLFLIVYLIVSTTMVGTIIIIRRVDRAKEISRLLKMKLNLEDMNFVDTMRTQINDNDPHDTNKHANAFKEYLTKQNL